MALSSLLAFSFLPDLLYVTIFFTVVLGVLLSWKTVIREPLDYDIYVVETQASRGDAATRRRVAQVVHLGYEERALAGIELMNTLATGRVLPNIEDISVVIQSPSTIVESTAGRGLRNSAAYISTLRLWMMEVVGEYEWRREGGSSGLAAAIAIAVANGRNEIQTGDTRIRLIDFEFDRGMREEEIGRVGGNREIQRVEGVWEEGRDESDGEREEGEEEEESTPMGTSPEEEERRIEGGEGRSSAGMEEQRVEEEERVDGPPIKLRLKFLDDTLIEMEVPNSLTVSQLKDRIMRVKEMENMGLRLIFRGQLLRNEYESLADIGMEEDSVVHVLIGARREEPIREERREGGRVGGGGGGGEGRREERRDDLEGRVADHMDYIREVINMSALLLMGATDALGSTFLSGARMIRNRVEGRIERAREEGRVLGYVDTVIMRVASFLGILETAPAPLPGIPTVSILFPAILGIQILSIWFFIAFFPRFFDFTSVFMLFIISSAYGFFYRQNHARVNQNLD